MWFGEPHPFPVRGSPTRLSTSEQQRYEGWSCTVDLSKTCRLAVELTQWVRGTPFPGSKVAGAWRWPYNVHILQTLRMGGAMPLLPPAPWRVQEHIYIVCIGSVVTLNVTIYRVFSNFRQSSSGHISRTLCHRHQFNSRQFCECHSASVLANLHFVDRNVALSI